MRIGPTLFLVLAIPSVFAQQIEVSSIVGFSDTYGGVIIGVVENSSDAPVEFVKIVSSVYDEQDGFLDSDYTYSMMDVLLPGEWSPFRLSIRDTKSFHSYDYQLQWQIASTIPLRRVQLLGHRGRTEGDYFSIGGQVRNIGTTSVEFVKIIVAAYDAQDRLVGADYTYTSIDVLTPGASSPFEVLILDLVGDVHKYDLIVQSQPFRQN